MFVFFFCFSSDVRVGYSLFDLHSFAASIEYAPAISKTIEIAVQNEDSQEKKSFLFFADSRQVPAFIKRHQTLYVQCALNCPSCALSVIQCTDQNFKSNYHESQLTTDSAELNQRSVRHLTHP